MEEWTKLINSFDNTDDGKCPQKNKLIFTQILSPITCKKHLLNWRLAHICFPQSEALGGETIGGQIGKDECQEHCKSAQSLMHGDHTVKIIRSKWNK